MENLPTTTALWKANCRTRRGTATGIVTATELAMAMLWQMALTLVAGSPAGGARGGSYEAASVEGPAPRWRRMEG